jgi:hypothetical protein
VTVTEQLPDERAQVFEEKVTVPCPDTFDQVTVPVGEDPPSTVAVHVPASPTLNAEGHTTDTVVVTFRIVTPPLPELGEFPESPP